MTQLRNVARIAGMLTVVGAALHTVVGLRTYPRPGLDALWWHGTGWGIVLAGALTMLAASHRAWRALGAVALGANVVGFGIALAFGFHTGWRTLQAPLFLVLFAVGALGCLGAVGDSADGSDVGARGTNGEL